jgi:hypothetical protein
MNGKKKINKKVRSLRERLAKRAIHIRPCFDEDEIHSLRTDFKKLRALLRWQKISSQTLKPFKKVYRVAGKLRNRQVVLKNINDNEAGANNFKTWLNTTILNYEKQWKGLDIAGVGKKILKNNKPIKEPANTFNPFVHKRIAAIKQLLQRRSITDNSMHEIRKMLKDIQYIDKYLLKENVDSSSLINNLKLKNLNKKIGNYIDKKTEADLLRQYIALQKDSDVKKKALLMQEHLTKKKDAEKKKLLKLVENKISMIA